MGKSESGFAIEMICSDKYFDLSFVNEFLNSYKKIFNLCMKNESLRIEDIFLPEANIFSLSNKENLDIAKYFKHKEDG